MAAARVGAGRHASHDEFRDCVEQIVARTEASLLSALPGELEEESEPDLCIVLAGRPGEFTPEVIESLRQRAPLVRVVGLLGSWCEGEAAPGVPGRPYRVFISIAGRPGSNAN